MLERAKYFAGNLINNSVRGESRARRRGFQARRVPFAFNAPVGTPSPGRAISESFLDAYPWSRFLDACGRPSIHEIGCGSGRAAEFLSVRMGTAIDYAGADIKPHALWQTLSQANASWKFSVFDGINFSATIPPNANFFYSQSAAEHIAADGDYFAAAAQACAKVPVSLQIHFVPAPASLRLYGLHGFRQYPPDRLAELGALQSSRTRWVAFAIGGPSCTALHVEWIGDCLTGYRADRRAVDPEGYRSALAAAALADMTSEPSRPIFWAFVCETGFSGIIV
jgi:SAM-dependent methyltransferase